MKTTLFLAVPALFAGAVLGASWRGVRGGATENGTSEAEESTRAPEASGPAGESSAGSPTLSAGSPGTAPNAPAALPLADLHARFDALLAAKDGDGVRVLVRELQERGEEAFPLLAELFGAILNLEDPKSYGLDGMQVERLMNSARMRPFAAWGAGRPDLPAELRGLMMDNVLTACDPADHNRLLLEFLRKEPDADNCISLAWSLQGPTPEEVTSIIDAFQAMSGQPRVARALLNSLSGVPTADAIRFIEGQTASADPKIAEQARVSLRIARPPVAGVLMTNADPEGKLPFQAGDIVVSWNGAAVGTTARWWELCKEMRESGGKAVLEVERNGVMEKLTLDDPPYNAQTKAVKPAGGKR
jgi:hypothetical protein